MCEICKTLTNDFTWLYAQFRYNEKGYFLKVFILYFVSKSLIFSISHSGKNSTYNLIKLLITNLSIAIFVMQIRGGLHMPTEKKSILQPKNDVVFKALFSRGKPRITQAMLEERWK